MAPYDADRWTRRWATFAGAVVLLGLLLPVSYPQTRRGSGRQAEWAWEWVWDAAQRTPVLVAIPLAVGVSFLLCARLHPPARGRALAFAGIGFWFVAMTVFLFRDLSDWTTQRELTPVVAPWLCAVVAGTTLFVANHFRRRYPGSQEARAVAAVAAAAALLALLALRAQPEPEGFFARAFTTTAVVQFVAAGLAAVLTLGTVFARAGRAWERSATGAVSAIGFGFVFLGVPADAHDRFWDWLGWVRISWEVPDAPVASVLVGVAQPALRGIGGALVLAVGIAAWLEPWIARRHRERGGVDVKQDLEDVFG